MAAGNTEESPRVRLRRRAMDFLARREHTFTELQVKLVSRHPDDDPELISEVLGQLQQENLLSDERFVESYINHRMRAGIGPLKLGFELKGKGAVEADISAAMSAIDRSEWQDLAIRHLQRKFASAPSSMTERQKAWRFLQQRGFDSDCITGALENAWPVSDELL